MVKHRSLRWKRFSLVPIVVAAAMAGAPPLSAQPKPKQAQPGKPSSGAARLGLPELTTWELDNGLKVAFMPVDSAPVVAVELWYHVGSKDEPRDRRGSAHMFEHMMFKGTKRVRPEEHARHLSRIGGYSNAQTTEDATWYIDVVPSAYLEFACQLEAERMRNLLFRDAMIKTEREVVKEEIRQQENHPIARGLLRFREIAYTRHPYAWNAGGTIEDLDATTAADLKRFYDAYYVPQNAMLVVVGNVTEQRVRDAASKWFGSIPRGDAPPRPADPTPEPAQTKRRREVVEPGQIGVVLNGYHIPEAKHDDVYALQVASLILGAGESSRLHQRLVGNDKLAVQAGTRLLVWEHPGQFMTIAVYLDPTAGDKVEAALLGELAKLARTPVTSRELTKAKNQLQSAFVFGLENVAGVAQQIGTSWIQTGDPGSWLTDLDRYSAVTAADVQRVAGQYLIETNLTTVVIPPAGAAN